MRIHGRKILGFPCGDVEVEQQICDFYIEEDSHEFVIEVDDYPIEKAFDLLCRNESLHKECLFCVDENEKAFTLYNCYLMPLQIPVRQMKIIWNKCLIGYHIEDIQSEKIKSAEYIVQTDKKYPFHMFVGKNCFDILNGIVHISTDWNQENTNIEGVAIYISVEVPVTIAMVEKIILRLLEIYFLQIGFFPKVEKVPLSEPAKYVTADEYLSGNVRAKLITAKAAAQDNPEYAVNVSALERVIPKDLPASEISVRLGTTWIPQEDIQRFMVELLTPSSYAMGRLKVRYTPMNGDWLIENKSSDVGNVKADSTYGTKRASAYRIIEDTLNLRDTRIFDYVDENGKKTAVLNHKETTAAQAKQEVIKQAFQDWIWKDPERRNRLVRYYNDTFNSVRPREYDGSHIKFGGISPEITLRPHQVNAIAHILYGGNTLLAHKVGAGKTFEMVAAAQESKRLGLCQKSMFVVPNHLVGQWASEYLRLYPSANILVTTKQDFETGNRKKFCGRIATGDYDAVIIGHSQFEKIPISEERQREQLMRQLDDIERGIDDVQANKGEQFTVKQLMKTRKAIKAKLDKLNDTKRKDNVINFEELGVDRLFIDESHFYKNLYLYTKMRNVGGIAQTEAQKSSDLFMKCRYLDEITGNRGTIFATGTPISNSMVVRP